MSDHYCCKSCGQRYDKCKCPPLAPAATPRQHEVLWIEVWKAHGDGGEHGIGPVIAYCSTESQAKQAAAKQGWCGGDGAVTHAPALKIDGKVWVLAQREPIDLDSEQAKRDEALRAKTLASLNAEQRRVLGLKA